MKDSIMFSRLIATASITTLLFGALYTGTASAKTYNVDVVLDSDQKVLTVEGRGNCRDDNHPGCVQTQKGKDADIKFHLKNQFTDCNKAEGAQWELSEVYLGGKDSPTKPTSWGDLDAQVISDFDVADAATGLLKNANGSNERKLSINNKNQYVYSIWYTVVANCVDSDGKVLGVAKVDPRVTNVGK